MRTRLTLLFTALVGSLTLSADVLFWQVAKDDSLPSFYFAQMVARGTDSTEELNVFNMETGTPEAWSIVEASPVSGGPVPELYAYLDSARGAWSGYSFVVELLNENLDVIATSSGGLSYSDFAGHIKTGQFDRPTALAVSGFTAVPEPTSGLLVLLGASALVLKRKRV